MKRCHKCGTPWVSEAARIPPVKESCPSCNAFLHCCLNCRHHDVSRPNQCRVPNTETVVNRAHFNFCDEFDFLDADAAAAAGVRGTDASRDRARAIFGGGEEADAGAARLLFERDEDSGTKRRFEDLFKD